MSALSWLALLFAIPFANFAGRVEQYVKLHNQVRASTQNIRAGAPAESIQAFEARLGEGIRQARPTASQGDLFTPETAIELRRSLAIALKGPDSRRVRASLRRSSPAPDVKVQVNQTYPPALPLQSMPPTLLKVLPPLPRVLEYRLIGHTLVLRDVEANLIVDFVPEAVH